ncbi:MAG: hypothetical protein KDB68_04980 [Planctomycetes bacterium]|nr:hypothetical protein [Planctomycetota bacterium]
MRMITDDQIKALCDEGVSKLWVVKTLKEFDILSLGEALKRVETLYLDWSDIRGSGSKGLHSSTYQQITGMTPQEILMEQGRVVFKRVLDLGVAEMQGFTEAYRDFKKQEGLDGTVFSMLEA